MKTILITGANGFIGSHATKKLIEKGWEVITLDSLYNSFDNKLLNEEKKYIGDIRDENLLDEIMIENEINLIMHFAGLISVPESVEKPELYMEVNHIGTRNIIEAAKRNGIKKIIFSSTAATYGIPKNIPINEDDEQKPINPYGESKLMAEREVISSGLQYSIFRYFNVAGSAGEGLGYFPKQKASHLIPLINDVASKNEGVFKIFGNDYNTDDGTCVRDYVHVSDLVDAHIMAAERMIADENFISQSYNISSGKGYSVKEVYDTANKVHGKEIPVSFEERRAGDPDKLIASSTRLEKTFGWSPKHTLEDMIRSDFNKTNK